MSTRQVEDIHMESPEPGDLVVRVRVHVGTLWQARLWSVRWLMRATAGLLGATITFEGES